MKIGLDISCLFRTGDFEITDKLKLIKEMGFDGVELAVSSKDEMDIEEIKKALVKNELECTVGGGLTCDANIFSENAEIVENGVKMLMEFVDCAHAIDAQILGGVLFSAWNEAKNREDRSSCMEHAIESLKHVSHYAKSKNVKLCLEVLNRYETDSLNTLKQGREIINRIGSDNVFLHFDSYHANIEEKDIFGEIHLSKGYIGHVHFSDNDRSAPGHGHIDFLNIMKALKEIDYDGWIVIECFPVIVEGMSQDTYTWRNVEEDGISTATNGLEHIMEVKKVVYGD